MHGSTFGFGWPSRTRIDESTIFVAYQSPTGGRPPQIDEGWLADADLVRVEARKIGDTTRTVVVPEFTVPAFAVSADGAPAGASAPAGS